MPRVPRNLHIVAALNAALTMRSAKKHVTRHVAPATQNNDGHVQSIATAMKIAIYLVKTLQK